MSKSRVQRSHRRFAFEQLEKRQLLAAYISELMVEPLFESGENRQFIELRGAPNQVLDPGTYFVIASDRDEFGSGPGRIHGIFDLSGIEFGSNGYLVLLPQDSIYTVDTTESLDGSTPNVLQSTEPGFGNIGEDIYSDETFGTDAIDFILGANTYFLLKSDIAPQIGDDIDLDNDGLIDEEGVAASWEIYDSISLHPTVFTGPVAYGQIVFVEQNSGTPRIVTAAEGVEVINTQGFGYAARLGESTGHTARDWVTGTMRDQSVGTDPARFRFEKGIFGVPEPRVFLGRDLDNIGTANYIGGVRGVITEEVVDEDGNGQTTPVQGVSFLADTNGNGVRDTLTFDVEPNRFPADTELTNAFPGVTLSTVAADGRAIGFDISSEDEQFNRFGSNRIFASAGITFFPPSGRLRIDFYRPARSVSITVIAGSTFSPTYGRLEAFNAAGESLGFVRSRALFGENRERITVAFGSDSIAYAVAYSDSDFLNSTPFGRLDSIRYTQSEALATTDENGYFALDRLMPGQYDIVPINNSQITFAEPLETIPIEITRYENFNFSRIVENNSRPIFDDNSFAIEENPISGAVIGQVVATDADPEHSIIYSLPGDNSPLAIDAATGIITVAEPSFFDFEARQAYEFIVRATDSVGGITEKEFTLTLVDINESPMVSFGDVFVSEEADNNSVVGRIEGIDPEDPDSPVFYEIVGGSGQSFFSVDSSTGLLRVQNVENLSFETNPTLTIEVAVSDSSLPPLVTTAEISVSIGDANDAPEIVTSTINVSEALATNGLVGTVAVQDEDVEQTHTFQIVGGNDDHFRINFRTGQIFLRKPLDFETRTTYELIVQAVDSGVPPKGTRASITINVLDFDEPAMLAENEFSVPEDVTPGSVVGTLRGFDPEGLTGFTFASDDSETTTLLFDGLVTIDPVTGVMTVSPDATFDADADTTEFTDRVLVFHDDELVGEGIATLTIVNVNEPPVILTTRVGYPEALPTGRAFARIVASDPERDQVTFEVVGDEAERFEFDSNNLLRAISGATLDFEATPEIDVEVRVSDASGLSSLATITVFEDDLPRFGSPIPNPVFQTGLNINFTFPNAFRSPNVVSIELVGANLPLPSGLRFDSEIARISGLVMPTNIGVFPFSVRVKELDGDATILKEETFSLTINRSEKPLFNVVANNDVDGNGAVQPIDALRVINFLKRTGGGNALNLANRADGFFDTDGDNQVTPVDALRVINEISRRARGLVAESEGGPLAGWTDVEAQRKDTALEELLAESTLF